MFERDWADPCGFHNFYHYIIDARVQAEYNPCPILFRGVNEAVTPNLSSTWERGLRAASAKIIQADDQVAQVVRPSNEKTNYWQLIKKEVK